MSIKVLPSHLQNGHFFASIWQNSERETIAANIVFICEHNGDKWIEFSWEDYKRMCEHSVTDKERRYLNLLKVEGYLGGDPDMYKPTVDFIKAIFQFVKPEFIDC